MKFTSFIFILILISSCKSQSSDYQPLTAKQIAHLKVHEYIDMSVELQNDTIRLGDELIIDICFENTTDSVVYFYPNSAFFMEEIRPSKEGILYGFSRFLSIDLEMNDSIKILFPGEKICIQRSRIILKNDFSFFDKGLNERIVSYKRPYIENEITGNMTNIQCGFINSQPFTFYFME